MKKLYGIAGLLLVGLSVLGQPQEYKGYFGISGGLALPVGNFATAVADNEEAGYAEAGFSGFVSTQIEVADFIGFAGMIGYSKNPYDARSFAENYRQAHPGINYAFSSDPYEMLNILGGAYVSLPQGMLDINLKGYLGVSVTTLPASSSETTGNPSFLLETGRGASTDFVFGGGINLMLRTNKHFAFLLDAIYLQSNPEFNAVEIRVYENGQLTVLSALDFKQKFQVILLDAGIAFTF